MRVITSMLIFILAAVCDAQEKAKELPLLSLKKTDPEVVENSIYLGLRESEVKKLIGDKILKNDRGNKNIKHFTSAVKMPSLGGYFYVRVQILTFKKGKVIKHEWADRMGGCVMMRHR